MAASLGGLLKGRSPGQATVAYLADTRPGPKHDPNSGPPCELQRGCSHHIQGLGILCKGLRVDFDAVFDTVVVQVPSGVGYGLALWLEVGPK